jgi:PAS domain S-box-containing protein
VQPEQNERLYRLLSENSKDIIILHDLTGAKIFISDSFYEICGYVKEDLVDPPFYLTHTDDIHYVKSHFCSIIFGDEKKQKIEYRIINKTGTVIWLESVFYPIFDGKKEIANVVSISRDISKRKRTKEQLQTTEKIAKIGSWEVLFKENEHYWSKEIYNIFDFDPKEIRPSYENYKSIVHPDDAELISAAYAESVRSKEDLNIIYRLLLKNGSIKYVNERAITYYDEGNVPIRYVGTIQDISELHMAQKNLIENEKFINSINNSVPVILFIYNLKDKKVTYVNNQITFTLGYTPDEIYSASFTELTGYFINDKLVEESDLLFKINLKNKRCEKLMLVKHKKAGLKWLNMRFVEFKTDEAGNILEFIGSAADVTDQKKSERKLNALMRLNLLHDKKTQKIKTLALIQGQEEERRRISKDIHDGIGQMLTALKLNIENFNSINFCTEKEKEMYKIVQDLIKETILEVRRVSNALAPPGLYDFGLYSVTRQLLEQLSKTSEIKIHFDSNIQTIRYYTLIEVTLYRIIQESINNILKHSKAEHLEVNINQDERSLNLLIFDDGIGFSPDNSRIAINKKGGSGLKNIRERAYFIGANCKIISKHNKGCIIKISIPIKNCNPVFMAADNILLQNNL